jgi:hypothetical protein
MDIIIEENCYDVSLAEENTYTVKVTEEDPKVVEVVESTKVIKVVEEGPRGPAGPPGPSVDLPFIEGLVASAMEASLPNLPTYYKHEFAGLSSDVEILHGLSGEVDTMMVDDTGQVVSPIVQILDEDRILVSAGETLKGYIIISKA